MHFDLKIDPSFYERISKGEKTFEVRENEGFQMGDTVTLREFSTKPLNATTEVASGYTDKPGLDFKIGYVQVLNQNLVAFSLLPIKVKTDKK